MAKQARLELTHAHPLQKVPEKRGNFKFIEYNLGAYPYGTLRVRVGGRCGKTCFTSHVCQFRLKNGWSMENKNTKIYKRF